MTTAGAVYLWTYVESSRSYEGWHLTADAAGCQSLLAAIDALATTGSMAIPTLPPTAAILSVPNYRRSAVRSAARLTVRVEGERGALASGRGRRRNRARRLSGSLAEAAARNRRRAARTRRLLDRERPEAPAARRAAVVLVDAASPARRLITITVAACYRNTRNFFAPQPITPCTSGRTTSTGASHARTRTLDRDGAVRRSWRSPPAAANTNISSIRSGALYPSRGDSCKVTFENLDYQHATAAYDQIGLITVSNGDITDKVREEVRQKACRLGADALSLNASVDFGSRMVGGMTQFLVLRKREQPKTADLPAQTGI